MQARGGTLAAQQGALVELGADVGQAPAAACQQVLGGASPARNWEKLTQLSPEPESRSIMYTQGMPLASIIRRALSVRSKPVSSRPRGW